jgi:phospholipid/cholesterol/gamma-HCH transport system substrate-binding protein
MKTGLQATGVGLFFVLGLGLSYLVFSVVGDGKLKADEGYVLTAGFDDLKTLTPGSDVRLAGVRIGVVKGTSLNKGRAQAELLIEETVQIPEDSVAYIAMASLLGQNYIDVEYGSAESFLSDGNKIQTDESADFNDVLRQVGEIGEKLGGAIDAFAGLGGEGPGSLMDNINTVLKKNGEQLTVVLGNLEKVTAALASTEGTLGKLINDPEAYNTMFEAVVEIRQAATDAQELLADAKTVFQNLEEGKGSLGQLISDDTIAQELKTTAENLRLFSEKLNEGDGTLAKLVGDDELYRELRAMLQKADQALDSVGDSGPISAVAGAANALF